MIKNFEELKSIANGNSMIGIFGYSGNGKQPLY